MSSSAVTICCLLYLSGSKTSGRQRRTAIEWAVPANSKDATMVSVATTYIRERLNEATCDLNGMLGKRLRVPAVGLLRARSFRSCGVCGCGGTRGSLRIDASEGSRDRRARLNGGIMGSRRAIHACEDRAMEKAAGCSRRDELGTDIDSTGRFTTDRDLRGSPPKA
jgi:hypothetical protein